MSIVYTGPTMAQLFQRMRDAVVPDQYDQYTRYSPEQPPPAIPGASPAYLAGRSRWPGNVAERQLRAAIERVHAAAVPMVTPAPNPEPVPASPTRMSRGTRRVCAGLVRQLRQPRSGCDARQSARGAATAALVASTIARGRGDLSASDLTRILRLSRRETARPQGITTVRRAISRLVAAGLLDASHRPTAALDAYRLAETSQHIRRYARGRPAPTPPEISGIDTRYTLIDVAWLRPNPAGETWLSVEAAIVWGRITYHRREGHIARTSDQIAEGSGLSTRQVRRAIDELEECAPGAVVVERPRRDWVTYAPDVEAFALATPSAEGTSAADGDTRAPRTCAADGDLRTAEGESSAAYGDHIDTDRYTTMWTDTRPLTPARRRQVFCEDRVPATCPISSASAVPAGPSNEPVPFTQIPTAAHIPSGALYVLTPAQIEWLGARVRRRDATLAERSVAAAIDWLFRSGRSHELVDESRRSAWNAAILRWYDALPVTDRERAATIPANAPGLYNQWLRRLAIDAMPLLAGRDASEARERRRTEIMARRQAQRTARENAIEPGTVRRRETSLVRAVVALHREQVESTDERPLTLWDGTRMADRHRVAQLPRQIGWGMIYDQWPQLRPIGTTSVVWDGDPGMPYSNRVAHPDNDGIRAPLLLGATPRSITAADVDSWLAGPRRTRSRVWDAYTYWLEEMRSERPRGRVVDVPAYRDYPTHRGPENLSIEQIAATPHLYHLRRNTILSTLPPLDGDSRSCSVWGTPYHILTRHQAAALIVARLRSPVSITDPPLRAVVRQLS